MEEGIKIRFWGVRGSLPTPLTPAQIKSKISAAISRLQPEDAASPAAKERFLGSLPPEIFGTVGGNTSCVEVSAADGERLIFDAGSGLRELACDPTRTPDKKTIYHIFFSHFHWDHIQGLPFFSPLFNSGAVIHFYSAHDGFEKILENQMRPPYFPVPMKGASMSFHKLEEGKPIFIAGTEITCKAMRHPGVSFSYAVLRNQKKLVYATDVELSSEDFVQNEENKNHFDRADALIVDAQYTAKEAIEKQNWGHSAFSYAVDFAIKWRIKKIYLFHHEPTYDDKKIYSMLQSAKWYENRSPADSSDACMPEIFLAAEGLEAEI